MKFDHPFLVQFCDDDLVGIAVIEEGIDHLLQSADRRAIDDRLSVLFSGKRKEIVALIDDGTSQWIRGKTKELVKLSKTKTVAAVLGIPSATVDRMFSSTIG